MTGSAWMTGTGKWSLHDNNKKPQSKGNSKGRSVPALPSAKVKQRLHDFAVTRLWSWLFPSLLLNDPEAE